MQTGLTRRDPVRGLGFLSSLIPFGDLLAGGDPNEALTGSWIPPVDITEDSDRIVLTAELPGFREEQVDIQVDNGILTIKGEREFEKTDETLNYHQVERSYGQFAHSFTLPNTVDTNSVKARFEQGLLTIELPKRQEAKPRRIPITADSEGAKALSRSKG